MLLPSLDDFNKMTDSENSQPQDESDEDIYKDIPEFNFEDELAKLEGSKENYKQEASDLSEKVKILTEENKELKKSNEVLKKNLSTLLKTAQAEVQRKDSMIQELRTQVDSFTFRRNKTITKDKFTSTEDLKFSNEVKWEPEKNKVVNDKNRSSYENQTSSDSDLRTNREERRKESSTGREKNSDCDNDRKSGKHSNFKHSESSNDRYKEKKSSRYEDNSEYRRSYRNSHRDQLKSDSYDKTRHSRSSDSRFLSRHRHSRERRRSPERRRSEESSERYRRGRNRSRSRELSRGSKEPSIEKPKSRSSRDIDSIRIKEISNKTDVANGVKPSEVTGGRNLEKQDDVGKNKKVKEKKALKEEKWSGLDIFSTISPLDALYNEMVTSRSSNRFVPRKSGTTEPHIDKETEVPVSQKRKECLEPVETHPDEDWALSFKNERQNDPKPMTLYSRRMLRKFSSEVKTNTDIQTNKKEETEKPVEVKQLDKIEDNEKEPGELTDDENIVESSKEFQELAKVASIEIMEKPVKELIFKEPMRRESSKGELPKVETKEAPKEQEKPIPVREDPTNSKETEPNKETREVIEFSPFKNNYKLIEISPIKPPESEHVLDFYNQRPPPVPMIEQTPLDSSENLTESEKSTSKPSDTSDEKTSETELKVVIASSKEKKCNNKEDKEQRKKKDKPEDKKSKEKKQDTKSKRNPAKKESEKLKEDEKNLKRKRKSSETDDGNSNPKKRKLEKSVEKKTRNKRNSKTEQLQTEPEPESEQEEKVKDDISTFEFFKPVAKTEIPQTPVDSGKSATTTTDYKMTASMSVTGVVRLETPNKCVDKLKNLMINEHMIFNVLDSKNNPQFSPLIGSKLIEMTPRRMLKNDLMLTDSEDDSVCKKNNEEVEDEEMEREEVDEEEEEFSESENESECDSDSGASDFVDLL